jgi:hypothetical protein
LWRSASDGIGGGEKNLCAKRQARGKEQHEFFGFTSSMSIHGLGQSNIPVHLVTYENLVDNPERA